MTSSSSPPSSSPQCPQVIFGAGFFGNAEPFISDEGLTATYDLISQYGVTRLDSAQLYGESERRLGETKAGDRFAIDTKWLMGWSPGKATKDGIVTGAQESVKKLGCVPDVFYLHCPDVSVPIEETLSGVNEAYKLGLFKRFGLSNYPTDDVVAIYEHCKAHGYVLPSVFQGNYAPVARKLETLLLPTLRQLGIVFYAYSPLAGGFLTKTKQQIVDGAGRFNTDFAAGMYDQMYLKESYLAALALWEDVAREQGCSRAELAYRWVAYHSALRAELGDGIIIGASKFEQIEPTLQGLQRGRLKDSVVKRIDEVWETVKHDAPMDAFAK
ncbi:aldehyde reductase (GliO) [Fonsecaea erecta]|uniref:Aldehyde reductase (GliO) n=1 Tax=Fonsecaea erecta TaxID=1367422 RepID=A0A178ZSS6_9EURO|nr:aldehyde reductase (GliO) [Fonsecaea erecta]OAP62045.1 aldehyde reductase (GliO) [Fonsecaea erecta]